MVAAATIAAVAALSAVRASADSDSGRGVFASWSCGDCHTLADAGASGTIGPSLDDNPNLSYDFIIDRVMDGQGAMPPFGGLLTEEEIADLADYIIDAAQ